MNTSLSPLSMDTCLLLLSIVGYIAMATACPTLCQCNLDYYVYCRKIQLGDGQLRTVMANMPKKVRLLDLGFNEITDLPSGIFSDLPHLQILNLESNKISQLPNAAFQNLPNLVELSLNNNVIHQLTSSPWGKIPHLKKLDLEDNYIDYIDPQSFVSLSNLTDLSLRSNQIGVLEERTFSGLGTLLSLDVSNNIIQRIANGSFQSLNSLQVLDLSYNMLTNVHAGMFTGLTKLDTLNMDYNKISDLRKLSTAEFYRSLRKLHVSSNDLTSVPGVVFVNFHSLRELCLNSNKINTIPRAAFLGMSLDKLSLSRNKLKGLQRDMFRQIRRIRLLDFSHNMISSLSTGVFDSFRESVIELHLEENDLLYIDPGHFRGMIRLQFLNISYNAISIIKDRTFSSLRDLHELVLSGNDLERVTPAMLEGVSLHRLILACNPLKAFTGFRYDIEGNPQNVHMNLTVVSQTDESVRVRWPYVHGSQIYWTMKIICMNVVECPVQPKEEYLAPFKTEHVIERLSSQSEYYLCVNPVFVNKGVHIEQCIHIRTRQDSMTTKSSLRATEPLTSSSCRTSCTVSHLHLVVLLTVLLWGKCFTYYH